MARIKQEGKGQKPGVRSQKSEGKIVAPDEGGVKAIEKEIQRAGITSEDFELKPEKMKELGLEKIAMKVK